MCYVSDYLKCSRYWTRSGHTATGLDGLPVWFLRLAAPVFLWPGCRPHQSDTDDVNCAGAVEAGVHPAGKKK